MRSMTALLLVASSLLGAAPAISQAQEEGGRFYAVCASCHGNAAQGAAQRGAPRLNHLSPVYISAQLDKFRSGQRGGEGDTPLAIGMAGMAQTLPDEAAVAAVADYIASLESPASALTVEGDPIRGEDYYKQLCGACHGAQAQGNRALHSPRLAGSDDWYLVTQLKAFREGVRGSHPEDRNGRQMRAMAATLPDEQAIRDVVSYLHSLDQ